MGFDCIKPFCPHQHGIFPWQQRTARLLGDAKHLLQTFLHGVITLKLQSWDIAALGGKWEQLSRELLQWMVPGAITWLPLVIPSECSSSFHLSYRLDVLWIAVLKHEFQNQIANDCTNNGCCTRHYITEVSVVKWSTSGILFLSRRLCSRLIFVESHLDVFQIRA